MDLSLQRFSFTTSYCVEIIFSLTTQGVPDTATFTEGDGPACVCVGACVFVFRRVSAHPHEYAPSSYGYCPATNPTSAPHPLLLLFPSNLFVCLFGHFSIVIWLPGRTFFFSFFLFFFFYRRRRRVGIYTGQGSTQCKCKHKPTNPKTKGRHNMDPSGAAAATTLPLFALSSALELPLGHIMSSFSLLTRGPS